MKLKLSRFARLSALLSALALGAGACTRVPELSSFTELLGQSNQSTLLGRAGDATGLTLEHLQLKGSHNSYHQAPRWALVRAWRYSHRPLAEQLAYQGVRQIELDVRYQNGKVVVGHLPLIDSRSTCKTLKRCLEQIRSYSQENPTHLPIFVFIEPKEHLAPSNLDGRLEVLDETIASVFKREELIVPEDIAGDAPSLRAALLRNGWPTVAESRGKVAFVFFGRKNHVRAYAAGRPRLEGRLMFAAGDPDQPWAAVTSYDNPLTERDKIERAVRARMLVRTRADSGLKRDRKRRDAALASGAHFVGSDFVDPKNAWIELGERAPVRCNPVRVSALCTNTALAEVEQVFGTDLQANTSPLPSPSLQ